MSLSIRIYGTVETAPDLDDLAEFLEECEFEATVEIEEETEDEEWAEAAVFEPSLDEPLPIVRTTEPYIIREQVRQLAEQLSGENGCDEVKTILHGLRDTIVTYAIEVGEEMAEDDNVLLMTTLVAQFLAQRSAGFYCVDCEGFFDEMGELLYEHSN